MSENKLFLPTTEETIRVLYLTNMDALDLLRRLDIGELEFIHTLEVFYPYTVVNAERISVGPHQFASSC